MFGRPATPNCLNANLPQLVEAAPVWTESRHLADAHHDCVETVDAAAPLLSSPPRPKRTIVPPAAVTAAIMAMRATHRARKYPAHTQNLGSGNQAH
eukprot:366070-Chlamydomonas_euryale.AAC.15